MVETVNQVKGLDEPQDLIGNRFNQLSSAKA